MNEKYQRKGVGYFDTVFSTIEIETMADTLKTFALSNDVTEDNTPGEVLNSFISTLIKTIDLQHLKVVAPQLFVYSKNHQETLEVTSLNTCPEELLYLKDNIDRLIME